MAGKKKVDLNLKPIQVPVDDTPAIKEEEPTKVCSMFPHDVYEQLKDFCYWDGSTLNEVVVEAVREYLVGKRIDPRPEKVKNRTRPGRKRNV